MLRHTLPFVVALGMLFGALAMPASAANATAKANIIAARQAAAVAARRHHRHHHHKVITTSPVVVPSGS